MIVTCDMLSKLDSIREGKQDSFLCSISLKCYIYKSVLIGGRGHRAINQIQIQLNSHYTFFFPFFVQVRIIVLKNIFSSIFVLVGYRGKSKIFNQGNTQCSKMGEKVHFQKCKKTLFAFSKMAKNQFLHQKKV